MKIVSLQTKRDMSKKNKEIEINETGCHRDRSLTSTRAIVQGTETL